MLIRVQTRWLRLGLFQLIRPTIKYQPGKATVVADTLSRSQRKLEEGSIDDSTVVAVAAIKAQISALNGVSVELISKDFQKWSIGYKEDKGRITAYMKLH